MDEQYSYKYIDANATTVVKASNGILKRLVIGTGAAGTTTIYDALTANAANIVGLIAANLTGNFEFDTAMRNGITIVTAANNKVTVVYR